MFPYFPLKEVRVQCKIYIVKNKIRRIELEELMERGEWVQKREVVMEDWYSLWEEGPVLRSSGVSTLGMV